MKKDFQIFKQADKESAAAEAGEHLNLLLVENLKLPVLLLVSAGSALDVLEYVGQNSLGENLTISVLDERFTQDLKINNFAQLQKTNFYQLAFNSECSFFGTLPRSGETMQELAKRWEANLRSWREENPTGLIIATLGMGADGHTAGIFPEPADDFHGLFQSDAWVAAYNVGDKSEFKDRVTTTLTFFKLIDIGLAFVCGAERKQKLDEVIANKAHINELPALAWHEIKEVRVFTDIN